MIVLYIPSFMTGKEVKYSPIAVTIGVASPSLPILSIDEMLRDLCQ
jgi:hypothetical protein